MLAGGRARRLGGVDKGAILVAGEPLLERVIRAVVAAGRVVVVGPEPSVALPRTVTSTTENPPGAGPTAALVTGLRLVHAPVMALLAADLPFVTAAVTDELRRALATSTDATGVIARGDTAADSTDDRKLQWLLGVWRTELLDDAARRFGDPTNRPLHSLLAPLEPMTVDVTVDPRVPPWFDCDTRDDLARAKQLANAMAAGMGNAGRVGNVTRP